MTTTETILTGPYDAATRAAWVLAALCSLAAVYGVTNAHIEGPKLRAFADQAKAQEIEQEIAAFCRKHAMPTGSDAYPACVSDLMEIRNRQEARSFKDFDLL